MEGNERERFCNACQRNVHNLSDFTRREAERLLRSSPGGLCARINYDPSGNVLFRPDPQTHPVSRLARVSLLGLAGLGCGTPAFTQVKDAAQLSQPTAETQACELKVSVADRTSAPIQGAQVRIAREQGGQLAAQGKTDANGEYTSGVLPGHYAIDIESFGFESHVRHDFDVSCSGQTSVSMTAQLEVGALMGSVVQFYDGGPLRGRWLRTKFFFNRLLHRS